MRGWSALSASDSTVELQSIKGDLSDVLEEFAYQYQVDPLPIINKSTVILRAIKDLLLKIQSNVENYDCDVALTEVVISAKKVHSIMNEYLESISPPTDPDLCDARLSAMSLALINLGLVTSHILSSQWLQEALLEIEEQIADLREYLVYDPDECSLTKV